MTFIHSRRSVSEMRGAFGQVAVHLQSAYGVAIAWPYTPPGKMEELDASIDIERARKVTIAALNIVQALEVGNPRTVLKRSLRFGEEACRLNQDYLKAVFPPGHKARRKRTENAEHRRRLVARDYTNDRLLNPTRKLEALEQELADEYGVTERTIRTDVALGRESGEIPQDI